MHSNQIPIICPTINFFFLFFFFNFIYCLKNSSNFAGSKLFLSKAYDVKIINNDIMNEQYVKYVACT